MSTKSEKAVAMFQTGCNCAQSVLAACGQELGLAHETALRVAQTFGGGMGRTGSVCGALTGALMAVGLRHAALDGADTATKMLAYDKAQRLMQEFARRNGFLLCRDLTGCDLTTSEGQKQFKDKDVHNKICVQLVRSAVEIFDLILPA